jgi:hypothetical protein
MHMCVISWDLQLNHACLQWQNWHCIISRLYGCVCNEHATNGVQNANMS